MVSFKRLRRWQPIASGCYLGPHSCSTTMTWDKRLGGMESTKGWGRMTEVRRMGCCREFCYSWARLFVPNPRFVRRPGRDYELKCRMIQSLRAKAESKATRSLTNCQTNNKIQCTRRTRRRTQIRPINGVPAEFFALALVMLRVEQPARFNLSTSWLGLVTCWRIRQWSLAC